MNPAPECGAIKPPKTDIYSEAPHQLLSSLLAAPPSAANPW